MAAFLPISDDFMQELCCRLFLLRFVQGVSLVTPDKYRVVTY